MKNIGIIIGVGIVTALLTFSGCARVGYDFETKNVKSITVDETTQSDILNMFGKPWRTGLENGIVVWTYGRYTYRLIGETDTKDLVIKFTDDKIVKSYNFNTSIKEK